MILDTEEYINKMQEDLRQNDKYEILKKNMTKTVENKVKKVIKQLHQGRLIDDKLKQYMYPSNIAPGKVKHIPKFIK